MQESRSINADERICGIDEAGRGPLAGPVTAAAVILPSDFPTERLRDSKKLSPTARRKQEAKIRSQATAYGLGWAWPDEIDELNILQAAMLAMQRAAAELLPPSHPRRDPTAAAYPRERGTIYAAPVESFSSFTAPTQILVDGNRCPEFPGLPADIPVRAEVGGDGHIPTIMAASILAKTARDRWMHAYDQLAPAYGFAGHKGYPTVAHRTALRDHGPSPIHRYSFKLTVP